jgi:hypothetical protein
MSKCTVSDLLLASPLSKAPLELVRQVLSVIGQVVALVQAFRAAPTTPMAACEFENALQALLRELGRLILEWTYNNLEPDEPKFLPNEVLWEGQWYRRRSRRARRGLVCTLFGPIRLVRYLYQPWYGGESSIFPLEINLGIEPGGATPALALRAAWLAAANTQQQTLDFLREDHGVHWSVKTLRKLTAAVAERLAQQRHPTQVARLLELLAAADASRGPRKIVLSVGRDGVFVPIRKRREYQEAATATVAVYDRNSKRLGTVYLGRMPQPGQTTISEQLTRLLRDVLEQWHGPQPRLCYVTDAGHHPTEYFHRVLRWMRHPRTGQPLGWEWVIDYFHVCGRISQLAEAIFGDGKEAIAWAKKMRRWMKTKASGAYRVLHSAAALKAKRGLRGPAKLFAEAYGYLSTRLDWLDYVDYQRRGLPIGSGVTEAACKTVFACRFKQAGMAWSHDGGQTILELRLLRLSNVWKSARDAYLAAKPKITVYPPTECQKSAIPLKIAA